MSSEQEFHDPVLKEAICRCWACDCAPKELHAKVASLLESEFSPPPRGRVSWMIWPAAMAAAVLLAVGVFHSSQEIPQAPVAITSALPVGLETDLISRHDACCKEANHQHLPVSINDDAGIAEALRAQLNRPVLVFHPQQSGWTFRGASICPVGKTPSGHLVFVRGSDTLSIFSLPKNLLPAPVEGAEYAGELNQHRIVGFVKDGALFCVVAAGPGDEVSLDQLKKMQTQMQPDVTVAQSARPAPVLLTELLHSVN